MNGQLVRTSGGWSSGSGDVSESKPCDIFGDGRNRLGESVASGLYFYTLTGDDFTATRRMLILK